MSIGDEVEGWLLSVCLKNGIVHGITVLASSSVVTGILTHYGVSVSWSTAQGAIISGVSALARMAIDYLKVKKGWTWL